jgi:hypothetical protein
LLRAHALGELGDGIDALYFTSAMAPASGSRHSRNPLKLAIHSRGDRQILLEQCSGASVALLAIRRVDRGAGDVVGDFVGTDGDVIVLRPGLGHHFRRADHPADAHAGNSIRFREAAGDDHAIAHAPERFRAVPRNFRAEVNFVGDQVRAHFVATSDDALHRVVGKHGSCGLLGFET